MTERRRTITPPGISQAEDPNATKRPAPPPTEEELEAIRKKAIIRAGIDARDQEQREAIRAQEEAIQRDSVAGPAVQAAEAELDRLEGDDGRPTPEGLRISPSAVVKRKIDPDEAERYNAWVKRRLEGKLTEYPPDIPEEEEEKK